VLYIATQVNEQGFGSKVLRTYVVEAVDRAHVLALVRAHFPSPSATFRAQ
jgi:hypothetical protein